MMAGGVDPAAAFLVAAGITDPTITAAINTLVNDLIGYGVWNKLKAIYPFVGGTATTHKFNLKNPADTDAAFRLSFVGGWTHSANGALPNGTNAYADTYFNPSALSQNVNSTHLSLYQRGLSNTGFSRAKIGAANTDAVLNGVGLGFFSAGTREVGVIAASGGAQYAPSSPSPAAQGFFMVATNGNRGAQHYINGLANGGPITQSGLMPNFNIHIARLNSGSSFDFYYFNKECAFASIGDGLSNTEAANYYTAVQAFQTTLNRHV